VLAHPLRRRIRIVPLHRGQDLGVGFHLLSGRDVSADLGHQVVESADLVQ
jgi:hypothetical protein